jgi:hypothetical protein
MKKRKPIEPEAFVKVIKSKLPTYWYKRDIGKCFFVVKDIDDAGIKNSNEWQVVEQNLNGGWRRSMYIIEKRDCRVVLRKPQ